MSRWLLPILLSLVFSVIFLASHAQELKLAKGGISEYKIVMPVDATEDDQSAASDLRFYLQALTGATLEIITDDEKLNEHEIITGHGNRHIDLVNARVKYKKLDRDGFHILTRGEHLVITGGEGKGTLYGVYTFLDKYLGCRMYTPGVVDIPFRQELSIPEIDDQQNPAFRFREIYFPFGRDQEYANWYKFNSFKDRQKQWGMWVHTFDDLLGPEEYFDTHPEYFSEIGGVRVPNGQLCLSNPDIPGILADALGKKIDNRPVPVYWSVSQNDNYLACQCDDCQALVDKYKSESGPVLAVVNEVAGRFPGKIISTLAYQYSRETPAGIRPAGNVNIMLCSIECDRATTIENGPGNQSFAGDLEDWKKLTEDILLWDYVVQFTNYISPFPNLRVLQPNIRYFKENGVTMMFQQGSGTEYSEFLELRTYLIARLLWDPFQDAEKLIDEFVYGYYGPAAPFIREYITLMHDALESSGDGLSIYGYPYDGIDSYLSPDLIWQYTALFDQAEEAVEDQYDYLERVIMARLPLEYAICDISIMAPTPELSYFTKVGNQWTANRDMLSRLENLTELANSAGIDRFQEGGMTPEQFKERVLNFVYTGMVNKYGLHCEVEMITTPSPEYHNGDPSLLTDGLKGLADYHYNWLGFEGDDMVAVIDLGQARNISYLEATFMQNPRSWIFMPESVTYEGSLDGESFKIIGNAGNDGPADHSGLAIKRFVAEPGGVEARYIRVTAKNRKTCPEWHIGAGEPAWIFVDEVVIE